MTYNLKEFKKQAQLVVQQLTLGAQATVLALYGDLGSGKTTFTQEIAKSLGVTEPVISPTFLIQKRYSLEGQIFAQLIHIDAYRIEDPEQLKVLNWEDLLHDPSNLIVIEWAEHVESLLPREAQYIHFTYIDDETRSISYGKKS